MTNLTTPARTLPIALLSCLLLSGPVEAKKPPKPPGGNGDLPAYTVVDLGEHQSWASRVTEPDGSGNVLVAGMTSINGPQPVIWDVGPNGSYLPPFHLGVPPGASAANVTDMNDAGIVTVNPIGVGSAWYHSPGVGYASVPQPGTAASAFAINNFGDVVGDADFTTIGGDWEGALWLDEDGGLLDPIPLGTFRPNDVNDAGLMVGYAYNEAAGRGEAAAGWLDASGQLQLELLGVLSGATSSEAIAVSSNGAWIVGSSGTSAFAWSSDTGLIALGTLGGIDSTALDVNDMGQVVGYSDTNGAFSEAAFIWENGTLRDLNDVAQTGHKPHLTWATSINEAGHITGVTRTSRNDSDEHGYVLIPNMP